MIGMEQTLLSALALLLLTSGELAAGWGQASAGWRHGTRTTAAVALACGIVPPAWRAAALLAITAAATLTGPSRPNGGTILGVAAGILLVFPSSPPEDLRAFAALVLMLVAGNLARLSSKPRVIIWSTGLLWPAAILFAHRGPMSDVVDLARHAAPFVAGWTILLSGLHPGWMGLVLLGSSAVSGPWGALWLAGMLLADPQEDTFASVGGLSLACVLAGPVAESTGFWIVGPDPGTPHLVLALGAGALWGWYGGDGRPRHALAAALALLTLSWSGHGLVWTGGWLVGGLLAKLLEPGPLPLHRWGLLGLVTLAAALSTLSRWPVPTFPWSAWLAVSGVTALVLLGTSCVAAGRPVAEENRL
ncbi:MAG: hypothetical protein VKO21_10690 [Candidatus Sericytochromatia bacterium]|nr:hypothetical protein [Candidatus Sericytochromatia bacterium]